MTIARLADPTLLRSHCYLNGTWVSAEGGETIAVTNPATGKAVGSVPSMSAAETHRAISAANEALPARLRWILRAQGDCMSKRSRRRWWPASLDRR